ncbi:hypothetical protein L2E82_44975 [Cichorium intybus]|uniref:Uncharacterized protein n=1 Tax=Cichorium intybus TaxID=13427 RepID=A0ACB8ZQU8_CICIN|nr:hypothetical protein L2E82_44975 [Cichorium intybus]
MLLPSHMPAEAISSTMDLANFTASRVVLGNRGIGVDIWRTSDDILTRSIENSRAAEINEIEDPRATAKGQLVAISHQPTDSIVLFYRLVAFNLEKQKESDAEVGRLAIIRILGEVEILREKGRYREADRMIFIVTVHFSTTISQYVKSTAFPASRPRVFVGLLTEKQTPSRR